MPSTRPRFIWLHPKLDKPMGGANFVLFTASQLGKFADVLVVAQQTSPSMQARCAELGVPLQSLEAPTFTDPRFWLSYERNIGMQAGTLGDLIRAGDKVITSMYPMNVIADRIGRNDIQIIYEPFSFFHDRQYVRNFGPAAALFIGVMRRLHVAQEIASTRAAGARLTLSRSEAEHIREVYDAEASVIYEGVDTDFFNPGVTPHPEFSGRKIILHSTGFDRYKGTDLVLAAMPEIVRRVPDALLLVTYTREDPKTLARYRDQLVEAGIARNVLFLGTVPFEQLPGLNRAATLYVEPGWDRPMSLSVKEAMACGTPVVRGAAGTEEITDGVEGFLVAPDDVRSYADRVLQLLADPDLRARMSQAAVARVTQRFTWAAVASRIADHAGFASVQLQKAV